MIQSVTMWHITPIDLGVEFLNPTDTLLEVNHILYNLVNSDIVIDKKKYSKTDYASLMKMRLFLSEMKRRLSDTESYAISEYPNISGCFAKFKVKDNLYCYVMISGIAVFFEHSNPIDYKDEKYFSIETFCERQQYEYDYCDNPDNSQRKQYIYKFLDILNDCINVKEFLYSSIEHFGNHGVRYTLCICVINDPELISNNINIQYKRNIRALLDTSAFNNVLTECNLETIRQRIDNDPIDDVNFLELSENLIFSDNWSGIVIAGDIKHNELVLKWMIEFEIWLQSHWLLFDAYCENVVRKKMTAAELQGILNRVEMIKVQLENDISSNMEQCRLKMRQSLIETSNIMTIYHRMHGLVNNKLKMVVLYDDKNKDKYAILSDISLSIIALLQVYDVINDFIYKETFTQKDFTTICVIMMITILCVWTIIRSRR